MLKGLASAHIHTWSFCISGLEYPRRQHSNLFKDPLTQSFSLSVSHTFHNSRLRLPLVEGLLHTSSLPDPEPWQRILDVAPNEPIGFPSLLPTIHIELLVCVAQSHAVTTTISEKTFHRMNVQPSGVRKFS
jgi:hypothetical protein